MNLGLTGFTGWIEKKLMPPLMKLAAKKSMVAVQRGVLYSIPVLIFFLIFFLLLFPITDLNSRFLDSFRAALFIAALFTAFAVSFNLGKHWNTGAIINGTMGILLFIATLPLTVKPPSIYGFMTSISTLCFIAAMIFAMAASFGIKLLNADKKINNYIAVSIIGIIICIIGALIYHFGINIYNYLDMVFKPILIAGDSLPGALAVTAIVCILWMGGVNGGLSIAPIIAPLYLGMMAANTAAFQAGDSHIPYIVTPPFLNFIFQGGGGTVLPLAVFMLFSKVKKVRKLGRISILPSIFNLNEVIVFGAPVVMNPLLWIPFLFAPLVLCLITYGAMYFNLVSKVIYFIPGIFPSFIVAYLSTGGDYRAVILALVNLAVAFAIYYPFFKAYEKLKANEIEKEAPQEAPGEE